MAQHDPIYSQPYPSEVTAFQPNLHGAAGVGAGSNADVYTTPTAQPGISQSYSTENYYSRASPVGPRNPLSNRTEYNRSPPGYDTAFAQGP